MLLVDREAKQEIVRLEQMILENGVQKGHKSVTSIPNSFEVSLQFKMSEKGGEGDSDQSI